MITFDKIRELERKEKEEKKIQELPENLLQEMKAMTRYFGTELAIIEHSTK